MFVDRNIASRLKELRHEKGLSFKQLSLDTGISHTTLCRWENEKVDIKANEIKLLAKYYKVSTDYLLGLED